MSINKKKVKKFIGVSTVALGAAFVGLSIVAKKKKADSIYDNEPEQKNPLAGKKVVFVEDETDNENADGVKGHLKAVGDTEYYPGFYDKYVKRAADIVLSFGGLVALSPVFLAITAAIKIDDPGPVLFTQKRLGQNKEYFKLHKFRSMKMSTPHDVPTHMLDNPDQYITRIGRFLRKHSLDELPQIWDIFIGNMSAIGPRPGLWNQDVLTAERDKYGANDVKPGLTGLAQINGRDELEIPDKAKLDGEYVKNIGLLMDIKCFLGSLHVFGKDDSVVEGGTGEMHKEKANGEKAHTDKADAKKKILVICQYYKPEPFRISDICEELVKRGHNVTVVTGIPNYPMGEIYDGYENNKKQDEIVNGVKVHRCFTVPRKTGTIHRMLNYYSYPMSSSRYVNSLSGDYDVVFINQLSPVMMAKAGIRYAKKHHKKTVLYCLDLWPESLVAGEIGRTSPVYKIFHRESEKIYKAVDKILVTSRSFTDYFEKEFGIKNIEYLPQYAEDLFTPDQCRKEPDGYIDLMFAGNVGTAQSVDTIIKAAERCKDIENLRWHIVGDGIELENLKKMADGLPVTFHGRKPVEDMPKYYAMADAMLVTMEKDPILSQTLPGKVQSYMAAGKAVLGAIDGETPKIINEADCGYIAEAEDSKQLSECVRKFVELSDEERKQLGVNGRAYYEKNFLREKFMDALEEQLIGRSDKVTSNKKV